MNDKTFLIRLDRPLLAAMRREAKIEGRSVAGFVCNIIRTQCSLRAHNRIAMGITVAKNGKLIKPKR